MCLSSTSFPRTKITQSLPFPIFRQALWFNSPSCCSVDFPALPPTPVSLVFYLFLFFFPRSYPRVSFHSAAGNVSTVGLSISADCKTYDRTSLWLKTICDGLGRFAWFVMETKTLGQIVHSAFICLGDFFHVVKLHLSSVERDVV